MSEIISQSGNKLHVSYHLVTSQVNLTVRTKPEFGKFVMPFA